MVPTYSYLPVEIIDGKIRLSDVHLLLLCWSSKPLVTKWASDRILAFTLIPFRMVAVVVVVVVVVVETWRLGPLEKGFPSKR